jgi:hypothetical protein
MQQMEAKGIAKVAGYGALFVFYPMYSLDVWCPPDVCLGITICADSTLGFDLPTSHSYLDCLD